MLTRCAVSAFLVVVTAFLPAGLRGQGCVADGSTCSPLLVEGTGKVGPDGDVTPITLVVGEGVLNSFATLSTTSVGVHAESLRVRGRVDVTGASLLRGSEALLAATARVQAPCDAALQDLTLQDVVLLPGTRLEHGFRAVTWTDMPAGLAVASSERWRAVLHQAEGLRRRAMPVEVQAALRSADAMLGRQDTVMAWGVSATGQGGYLLHVVVSREMREPPTRIGGLGVVWHVDASPLSLDRCR